MISKKFEDIWQMGAVRCTGCGEMKVHCALGMCCDCYNKYYVKTKRQEEKNENKIK